MKLSEMFRKLMESFKIRRQDLTISPFRFNEPQERVWSIIAPKLDARQNVWLICLKARRLGMSTFLEALMLARTLIEDHVHSLVMASNAGNTNEIWRMASTMIDHSPWKGYAYKARKEILLGRSKLTVATAATPDAVRGWDLTCVHGSETAFWERPETLLAALQCIPDNIDTFCFLESTANGKTGIGGLFYEEWKRASDPKEGSDFIPIFLPWHSFTRYQRAGWMFADDYVKKPKKVELVLDALTDEEREMRETLHLTAPQLAWRRWAIATKCQGDLDKFNQEYPTTAEMAFIQAGLPFFRRADLLPFYQHVKKGARYIIRDQKLVPDTQGYFEVFTEPKAGGQYVVGCDTSFGFNEKARSRSTAQVLDMETLEQVAEYEAATAPHVQARHLATIGRYYNNAVLAPEVQASGGGGGKEIIVYLRALDYWNIYIDTARSADKVGRKPMVVYGWETNSKTRPRMIARLREVISERSVVIRSEKLLTQIGSIGENESHHVEALQGHDDLLFAFMIALVVRVEVYTAMQPGTAPRTWERSLESIGLDIQEYSFEEAMQKHREKVLRGEKTPPHRTYLEM